MKKVRSDSKIMALPENQQLLLAEWLLDGNSYETAQTRLETEFGVKVGLAALSQFWALNILHLGLFSICEVCSTIKPSWKRTGSFRDISGYFGLFRPVSATVKNILRGHAGYPACRTERRIRLNYRKTVSFGSFRCNGV